MVAAVALSLGPRTGHFALFRRRISPVFWILLTLLIGICDGVNNKCPSSCSCLGVLVDCSKKGLIDVPRDLPIWAGIIVLQNNDITSIPEEAFRGLENLTEIDLSINRIRYLNSSAFQGLNNLVELKVNGNFLSEIPKLGNLPKLQNLILHRNNIVSIDGTALESLPNLQHLDLNSNKVLELKADSFPKACVKLQQLSLNHNRIREIEKGAFDNLTSLQSLKLNKNNVRVLRKDLFQQLENLKNLELSRNQLTQIEGLVFQNLKSLQILKLKRNNIKQLLDGAFWGLVSIKNLHLDNNNISMIAKGWLYGLTSLEQLTVSHNQISEIEHDVWEFCKRLLELDLTFNELEIISKGNFSKLENLRYLYLDNNKISYIEEGTFKSLHNLQVLVLKNNDISWSIEDTDGAFTGLSRLTKLSLANNKIKSIAKKAFVGLNKLKTLDISQNPVTSIQQNPFLNLKHLQTLTLDSQSLLCDCSLKWLPLWLTSTRKYISAQCGHPIWMRGVAITKANAVNFTCDDFPKPYITEEPETRIALKGANVTLVCKGAISSSASSDTTFRWRKDNKLLLDGNNVETYAVTKEGGVTEYVSILHLRNVQDQDEGRYQCVISNHLGSVYSQKAKITVHVFPVFTKTPKNVTAKAGSTARLECAVQGQPAPEIAWQKDGGDDFPAARERRMHVMPSDDVFFIVSVKLSDMGVYSCTAENAAGTIVANATLQVQEIPSFVKPMEDKQTQEGETAVLECMASGSPKPRLNWTKDGGPLIPTERHFFTAESQLLIIVQTQPSDTGRYVCEMTNALGSERDSAYLKVTPSSNGNAGGVGGGSKEDSGATTGIIIIAVVCCVVGTSLVWVVIIYQTRKRSEEFGHPPNDDGLISAGELAPFHHPGYPSAGSAIVDFKESAGHLFSDSNSEHSSKDSGTGESAKHSNDELLSCDDPGSHCHRGLLLSSANNRHAIVNGIGGPYLGSPLLKRPPSVSSGLEHHSDVSDELSQSGHTTCDSQSPLLRTFQTTAPHPHHSEDYAGRRARHHHSQDYGGGGGGGANRAHPNWASHQQTPKGNSNDGYYSRGSPAQATVHHAPCKSSKDDNGRGWLFEAATTMGADDAAVSSVVVPFKNGVPATPPPSHARSQRCFSAEQLSNPPESGGGSPRWMEGEQARLRLDTASSRSSEAVTPSGRSSTYPRSLSLATWSMGSLQAGQQDVPNDSGSFSIVSSETLPTSPRSSVSRRTLYLNDVEGRSASAPMAPTESPVTTPDEDKTLLNPSRTIVNNNTDINFKGKNSPTKNNFEIT